MNDINSNLFFLIIKKNKISFETFDPENGSVIIKETLINDNSIDNILFILENFLEKNILKIEKDLKYFIEKIFVIFESEKLFQVGSSIKHNFIKTNFNYEQINDSLVEIRKQFIRHSPKYETIHMIVNKFCLDGVFYDLLPENTDSKNLTIQINFICLEKKIVEMFRQIFLKYQISIIKFLSYEYLKNLSNLTQENIVKIAKDNINKENSNEVFVVKKTSKNMGFFEKFFNFFD